MNDLFDRLLAQDIKSIFDAFPKPMLVINPESTSFKIIGVNDEFLRSVSVSRQDLIGASFQECFPGYEHKNQKNSALIENALNSVCDFAQAVNIDFLKYSLSEHHFDANNCTYWNLLFKPIISAEGQLKFILCFPDNVTEIMLLKQQGTFVEAELELQQQRLFSAFMQAPFAIAILQGNEHIVRLANAKICSIWGKQHEHVIGHSYFKVTPGYEKQGFKDRLDGVLYSGQAWSGKEIPVYFIEEGINQKRFFNSLYEPFRDKYGMVQGVIVISVEVTEEVRFRNKITESENRLNLALEASHLGAWDLDRETGNCIGSFRYDEILGELKKKAVWTAEDRRSRILSEDLQPTINLFEQAWKNGILRAQLRIYWPDQSIHWIEMQGRVQFDDLGKSMRMIGTIAEITGQKKSEQQKDEFMGIVSHELRTPVTSLKAYCEYLEDSFSKNGDVGAAKMLGKMDLQIDKLTRLIADLLDKTKIEEGKMKMLPEFFSFNDLVHEIIEDTHRLSLRHNIEAEYASSMIVYADRERVGQVLINYLTNAIKYSPGGGKILISAYLKNQNLVCSVQDFGIGIPADKTNMVFSRFFRVHGHNSETYPGLGLGLYISAELITRQGGECWVKSVTGEGSTFYFSLPYNNNSFTGA